MESLGYGRHLIVDGYQPRPGEPETEPALRSYLAEVQSLLEGSDAPAVAVAIAESDGASAARIGAESHLLLHHFPRLGMVTLQLFSRRDVPQSEILLSLEGRFGVGRFGSHLSNATRTLSRDPSKLERVLRGDRSYARARLGELPVESSASAG